MYKEVRNVAPLLSCGSSTSLAPARFCLEQSLRASLKQAHATCEPVLSMLGSMLLLGVAACAAAAPAQLPLLFLLLATLGLPWRIYSFIQKKWSFFLIDYCYMANALVIGFILAGRFLAPHSHAHWLAALYSLSEGPLASALIMWQCAWVPSSVDHVTSVLMHLLPGLVLFTMRHCTPAVPPPGLTLTLTWGEAVTWQLVVPTAIYLTWQALYWLLVQVCCKTLIQAGGYDTSYKALSRRAARANSYLHRLGRRGGVGRRLCIFGVLQLLFTLATFLVGILTYYCKPLAVGWQVVKLCTPVFFGARAVEHLASKRTELVVRSTLRRLSQQGWAHPDFLALLEESGAYSADASCCLVPQPEAVLQGKCASACPRAVVHASPEGVQFASSCDRMPESGAGAGRNKAELSRDRMKAVQSANRKPRSGPRTKNSM